MALQHNRRTPCDGLLVNSAKICGRNICTTNHQNWANDNQFNRACSHLDNGVCGWIDCSTHEQPNRENPARPISPPSTPPPGEASDDEHAEGNNNHQWASDEQLQRVCPFLLQDRICGLFDCRNESHRRRTTPDDVRPQSNQPPTAITTDVAVVQWPQILVQSHRPEDLLHQMPHRLRHGYMWDIVVNRRMRYDDHTETVASFRSKLAFIGCDINGNMSAKNKYKWLGYVRDLTGWIGSSGWNQDPWFQAIWEMQREYVPVALRERRMPDVIANACLLQSITYCMVIRYMTSSGASEYQIYVGRAKNERRWNGHFTGVRKALDGNQSIQLVDTALAYFGPENAVVFVIGHFNDEHRLATEFRGIGRVIDLVTDPIGLNYAAPP
ncbi:hypothetical protein EDD86DRAFT_211565 [Gorgonomyces haynaldii]|nr:hypothetical protein EDD86DRAFT_211565 [Gorgonomyces haynaldii]